MRRFITSKIMRWRQGSESCFDSQSAMQIKTHVRRTSWWPVGSKAGFAVMASFGYSAFMLILFVTSCVSSSNAQCSAGRMDASNIRCSEGELLTSHGKCSPKMYKFNLSGVKSTLWESYKGSLNHLELNPLLNYRGIHTKVVVWITHLGVDSTLLRVDFHSKTKWSLIWVLKEWISTPAYLESSECTKQETEDDTRQLWLYF